MRPDDDAPFAVTLSKEVTAEHAVVKDFGGCRGEPGCRAVKLSEDVTTEPSIRVQFGLKAL